MADAGRIADYICSLEKGYGGLCERIAREARRDHVPIIRPETAAFLDHGGRNAAFPNPGDRHSSGVFGSFDGAGNA